MLQTFATPSMPNTQIISTLARLCREWQEATGGASLLETDGNMRLVLADLINGFGLNPEDQCRILRTDLFHEMSLFMVAPYGYRLQEREGKSQLVLV